MATETSYMRKPVTRVDWPTDATPAAFAVSGNATKPTAVTDPNVYSVPMVRQAIDAGQPTVPEVEELWQFQFRTDSATSDAEVVLWFHNKWLDTWQASALIEVKGTDLIDISHGSVWTMPGVLGTDYVGVQVSNHAGQVLYVTHMWS
jgi:hypothetical protein